MAVGPLHVADAIDKHGIIAAVTCNGSIVFWLIFTTNAVSKSVSGSAIPKNREISYREILVSSPVLGMFRHSYMPSQTSPRQLSASHLHIFYGNS